MVELDSTRIAAAILPWRQISHTAIDTSANPMNKRNYGVSGVAWSETGLMDITLSDDFSGEINVGQLIRLHNDDEPNLACVCGQFKVLAIDGTVIRVQLSNTQLSSALRLDDGTSYPSGAYDSDNNFTVSFDATPQRVLIHCPDTNTGAISVGPNSDANAKSLSPGEDYLIEMPHGYKFDLAAWFYKAANGGDVLNILYV